MAKVKRNTSYKLSGWIRTQNLTGGARAKLAVGDGVCPMGDPFTELPRSDAESDPNHLITETLNLSSADTLKLHLALDGGFVAQLAPARD